MNDSKLIARNKKTVVTRKYSEAISTFITKKPQGVHFKDVQEELTIVSPSTVSRNLKFLLGEGRIVKIGKKYYPSGADFAVPTFRQIIDVIVKAVRTADTDKEKEPHPAVRIALAELMGTPGHPSPYEYFALPDERDILTLEYLLEYIISGKITGMESFTPGLSQFLLACFRFRARNGMEINKPLLVETRRIEKTLFEYEGIEGSLSEPAQPSDDDFRRSAWYFIYTLLCETKDRQISDITDRILKFSEDESNKMKLENTEKRDNTARLEEELNSIKHKIRNVLWCDQLREVLFNRQFELFQKQLLSVSRPLLADFYGDLRQYAIAEHNSQTGSGAANSQIKDTAKGPG
jgi:DNA-binding Lrp family transcriptional regulator